METLLELGTFETAVKTGGNRGRKTKVYNIHNNNLPYLDGFFESLKPATAHQYGYTIKAFLASLGQKSLKRVTVEEIEHFINHDKTDAQVNVSRVHLLSILKWALNGNINNSQTDMQKDVLVWIALDGYSPEVS